MEEESNYITSLLKLGFASQSFLVWLTRNADYWTERHCYFFSKKDSYKVPKMTVAG